MNPKVLIAGVLAVGCVAGAAGGAYLAVRHNGPAGATAVAAPAEVAAPAKPVAETEAAVAPKAEAEAPVAPPAARPVEAEKSADKPAGRATVPPVAKPSQQARATAPPAQPNPRGIVAGPSKPAPSERPATEREPAAVAPLPEPAPEAPRAPEPPPAPPEPQFDEVILPSSSVIGLQVESSLSSERTRMEDRVEARVTRDVTSAGRVAIPAGSRVIGAVTLVERGGKMKERARLGVRFHTLVLADGREIPLRTESIFREGDSPSNESARKIGGAAIGGAILGAIMGGGKGAAIGSAAGAAGGSAAVMAGDRNAATLPAGTIVTVRLVSPATIEIERRN